MKKNTLFLLVIFLTTVAASCSKKSSCVAGSGGDFHIHATLKHHNKIIYSQSTYLDTVYVKYNSLNSPGENLALYDTFFIGSLSNEMIMISSLKCGDYYLLGAGYDTSVQSRVVGGLPITLGNSQTTDIIIPVTEGD